MSVRINTNIEALNAQRNLGNTAIQFGKSVEKLSSGLRINRAADDAAGLAISEKLRAQVRGLNQAQRNAQDGISMVQTAEGALNEVHSMLQRMRELAVQASNSTLSTADASSVNTEVVALKAEINRVAGATTFNGQYLLTGALGGSQVGSSSTVKNGYQFAPTTAGTSARSSGGTAAANGTLIGATTTMATTAATPRGTITLAADSTTLALTATVNGQVYTGSLNDVNGSAVAGTTAFTTTASTAGTVVLVNASTGDSITLGATTGAGTPDLASIAGSLNGVVFAAPAAGTALTSLMTNLSVATATADTYAFSSTAAGQLTLTGVATGVTQTVSIADMTSSAGQTQYLNFDKLGINFAIQGAAGDTAANLILGLKGQSLTVSAGSNAAANFQIGANATDSLAVTFADARTSTYGPMTNGTSAFDLALSAFTTAINGNSGVISAAQGMITQIDVAVATVSTQRGTFGAVQNRLEHTIASLGVSAENLASSESRIRDLDVAAEMVSFTKTQILQQAGTAILAQANQAPQGVLSLLK